MLESEVENAVVKHARGSGWTIFKINIMGNRGWPDRLFIREGPAFAFIEFKAPGKKPTKLQYYRLSQLATLGVQATWVDNIKEGVEFLDNAHD